MTIDRDYVASNGSKHKMRRYETIMEPTGAWAIFDVLTGLPAEFDGRPMIGLSREEADLAIDRDLLTIAGRNPFVTADRWLRPG